MEDAPVIMIAIVAVLVILGIGYAIFRATTVPHVSSPSLNSDGEGHYDVLGKRVLCVHCDNDSFSAREILLNTWLLSLLSLEWLDAGSTVLVCRRCGRLTWFSQASSDDD